MSLHSLFIFVFVSSVQFSSFLFCSYVFFISSLEKTITNPDHLHVDPLVLLIPSADPCVNAMCFAVTETRFIRDSQRHSARPSLCSCLRRAQCPTKWEGLQHTGAKIRRCWRSQWGPGTPRIGLGQNLHEFSLSPNFEPAKRVDHGKKPLQTFDGPSPASGEGFAPNFTLHTVCIYEIPEWSLYSLDK